MYQIRQFLEREREREIGSKHFIILINSLDVSDARNGARKSFIQQFSRHH